MKAGTRRKLTVLDAMILIAAAGAGIAAARAYYLGASGPSSVSELRMAIASTERTMSTISANRPFFSRSPFFRAPSEAAMMQQIARFERRIALTRLLSSYQVFLSVWTFALVLLGLRKPRPRLRRLVLEPGWAACFTAMVVLVVRTLSAVALWGAGQWLSLRAAGVSVLDDPGDYAGPAVAAVWLIIVMGGRGRFDWSSIGWLTNITAVQWAMLIFGSAAVAALAPL